jgi:cytochrome c oxidase subunit 2
VSDTRGEFDGLAGLYLPIAAAVVVLVLVLVVAFAVRYRARPGADEDDAAGTTSGGDAPRPAGGSRGRVAARGPSSAPRTELLYALLLAAVAALLLWRAFTVEARVDRVASSPALTVDVTAAKWRWRFDYPRWGIVQRGTTRRDPTLVVPAGEEVLFRLRATDVIHAFWIPSARFKRDATPGRTERFTLRFDTPGRVDGGGLCSEFCGLGHLGMRFGVLVLRPAAFAAWAQRRSAVG